VAFYSRSNSRMMSMSAASLSGRPPRTETYADALTRQLMQA
jgi:hypothetical protein